MSDDSLVAAFVVLLVGFGSLLGSVVRASPRSARPTPSAPATTLEA